jgi:lipoate-protein ligase A
MAGDSTGPGANAGIPAAAAGTRQWRLLCDEDIEGARNMARDWCLLQGVAAGTSPPTVRLYGWSPPCLSLGRHQSLEATDLAYCRRHAVDVVRRPTGGRAVLHHLELTYSVTAAPGRHPLPRGLQQAYRTLCLALVDGCRDLGIAASLTDGDVNLTLPGPRTSVPCFKAPAGGEVVVEGRKLVGSAMRARGGAILQHGSLLLDWDGRLQAGTMALADDRELRPHVTTLAEQLGRIPDRSHLVTVLAHAFERRLQVSLRTGRLSPEERADEEHWLSQFDISGSMAVPSAT